MTLRSAWVSGSRAMWRPAPRSSGWVTVRSRIELPSNWPPLITLRRNVCTKFTTIVVPAAVFADALRSSVSETFADSSDVPSTLAPRPPPKRTRKSFSVVVRLSAARYRLSF